jgi:hypothetical protein
MTSPLAIGSVRLFDKAVPDLPAGTYRLTSELEVMEGNVALPVPEGKQTHIRVVAPRFAFVPGDVVECFPPANATGAFDLRLPHVVLSRRTLPWERKIAVRDAPGRYPWLALLVLRSDEAQIASGTLRTLLPQAVVDNLEANEDVAGDPPVTVLFTRDGATLRSLLPTRDEAALLAHVRQVNLADTAHASGDDDGWFAVIAANRLPVPDGGETTYLACLVSLEGREDIWIASGAQAIPPLILIQSWPFFISSSGGTFDALAAALDVAPFGGAQADEDVLDAEGRVTVGLTDFEGAVSSAKFRGPLLGLTDSPLPVTADDISLSAAYELGRLLGIADGRLLRDLVEWHRKEETKIRAALEIEQLSLPANLLSLIKGVRTIATLQQEAVLQFDTSHLRLADIGRLTLTEIDPYSAAKSSPAVRHIAPEVGRYRPPNPDRNQFMTLDTLGAQMMSSRMDRTRVELDTPACLLPAYAEFALARLRLLHDVPFRYLVPDACLLPNESVRFFTLDETWLDSLVEGALNAASNGSRERIRAKQAAGLAKQSSAQLRFNVRKVELGKVSFDRAVGKNRDFTPGTVSGMMLRSRLLTDWPRMAIRGWSSADPVLVPPGADPDLLARDHPELVVPVLRFERLDPAILLVLFDGVPDLIWFEEPHTAIQFGVEPVLGANQIIIRDEQGKDTSAKVTIPMRSGPAIGVIDMAQLADAIDSHRPLAHPRGSGGLAQQLLRPPARQRFIGGAD